MSTTAANSGRQGGRLSLGAGALPDGLNAENLVVIRDYHEAHHVLRNPKVGPTPGSLEVPIVGGNVNKLDGREHVRRRRALSRAFKPQALAWYKEHVTLPAMRRNIASAFANVAPDEPARTDLVPLLHRALMESAVNLMGLSTAEDITEEQLDDLIELYPVLDRAREVRYTAMDDDERTAAVERAVGAKCRYAERHFEPAMCAVRERFGDEAPPADLEQGWDVVLSIVSKQLDPAYAEDPELGLRETIFLLGAAIETTTQTTTNVINELEGWVAAHPEDADRVTDDAFLADAVAETLRLRGHEAPGDVERPPTLAVIRVAKEDITLSSGREIKQGQWIIVNLHEANMDSTVFGSDADQFNPRREVPENVPRYGIAFGHGPHYCIGLPMVIGEAGTDGSVAQIAKVLFEAGVKLDRTGTPRWEDRMIKLKWESVPVLLTRRPDWLIAAAPPTR